MSFDNHLCTNQNICLMIGKRRQNFFMPSLIASGIEIHPQHFGLWKTFLYNLFNFLCACFKSADIWGTTFWANLWHLPGIAAIMAYQPAIVVLA